MTVIEQIHSFWLKAKTLDETAMEQVKSFDVLTLLNNAQDILIDELVRSKAWHYLRPITTSFKFDSSPASTPPFDSSYVHGIEDGTNGVRVCELTLIGASTSPYYTFRNYVRSQSNVDRSAVPVLTGANISNEDIPVELLKNIETNGTNTPMFTQPKSFIEGKYLIVVGDGYTSINEVVVVFVRNPALLHDTTTVAWGSGVRGVVTTCELPVEMHEKIVDIAVNIYYSQMNAMAAKAKESQQQPTS